MKTDRKIPSNTDLERLTELYRAMGDVTRIKILCLLLYGELCVSELSDILNFNDSAVSHHLKTLRSARLVKSRRSGKNIFYQLNDTHIKWILTQTLAHILEKES